MWAPWHATKQVEGTEQLWSENLVQDGYINAAQPMWTKEVICIIKSQNQNPGLSSSNYFRNVPFDLALHENVLDGAWQKGKWWVL